MPVSPPSTGGGFNAPGVLTPGQSQLSLIQAGTQVFDPVTGTYYAPIVVGGASQPPVIPATTITASATGAAAAQVIATLPAVSGKTNYLTGIVVTSTNPAATVSGTVTVAGILGGTLSFQFVESNTFGGEMIINFSEPLPASAANVAIVVTLPAITSGGAGAVVAVGFVQ